MAVYIRKQPSPREEGPDSVMGVSRHGRGPSAPVKPVSPDPVSFDGNKHTLFVSDAAETCRRRGHPVERVTGILASLSGKPVRLRVDYCQRCEKYFVDKRAFAVCREAHGPLLGRYKFPRTSGAQEGRFTSLAAESILKRYGYSVSRTDDLKMGQRRLILANLMDRGIASKGEIVRYLEFDIANCRKRADRKVAVERWEGDLRWVRDYSIDPKRRFLLDTYREFSL